MVKDNTDAVSSPLFWKFFTAAMKTNTPHIKSKSLTLAPMILKSRPLVTSLTLLLNTGPQVDCASAPSQFARAPRAGALTTRAGCRGVVHTAAPCAALPLAPSPLHLAFYSALTCPHCGQEYTGLTPTPTACLALLSLTAMTTI